jgi:TolB-like protein
MSETTPPPPTGSAVFVSYASQDAAAALRLCEALRAAGVEVWFDQAELAGGDAWDQKIRGQIASRALFVPVISAATQARREGYFRLEWKLAAQRTHMISERTAFLLPVVIDETRDAEADVPGEFRAVQWTRLPGGAPTPQFVERVKKLLGGLEMETGRPRPVERGEGAASPPMQPDTPKVGRRVPAAAWMGALAVIAIGAGAIFFATRKSEPASPNAGTGTRPPTSGNSAPSPASRLPSPTAPAALDPKSVAVLAFANMSAEKDTEYFSDGISEEILNALDRIPSLRVTPRTSSFSFKGKNVALDEIGRALRVASVIEGSVRKAGNEVRITVKLLNAVDGSRVWSEEFNRQMTPADMFAVQSEIAAKVAQKLGGASAAPATSPVSTIAVPTKNLAAYDAYLRGRAALADVALDRATAVGHFEEALRLDPNYALAWAGLAQALVFQRQGGAAHRTEENATRARSAAANALRLSPDRPEAHLALALVKQSVDRDLEAAGRELDAIEKLHPGHAGVVSVRADLEYSRGHWGADFVRLVWQAVERDPQNNVRNTTRANALSAAGWFSEAARLLERVRLAEPTADMPLRYLTDNLYRWTGNVKAAAAVLDELPQNNLRNAAFYATRAELRIKQGNLAAALADLESASSAGGASVETGSRRHTVTYRRARLESLLGHAARAAELYAQTLAEEKALDWDATTARVALPALVKARLGQREEALGLLAQVMPHGERTFFANNRAHLRIAKAEVHAALGQVDEAVATLRTVLEMGYGFGYSLRLDLEWEPLRGDAKFQQLMKEAEARADAQPRPKK